MSDSTPVNAHQGLARSWASRVRRAFSAHPVDIGIAGRLGVAFAAVAVLAATANLIVEHGTRIIRLPPASSPIIRTPPVVTRIVTLPSAQAAPVVLPVPLKELDANALESIEEFERAVERRVESDTADNTVMLKATGARMKSQVESFLASTNAPDVNARSRSLRTEVVALCKSADDVVRAADERRETLAGYWNHFEHVDDQVKKTLDQNNWRIFGRVISRQSLLSLSRSLDDVRQRSTQLNTRIEDQATLQAVQESQSRFTRTLDQNAAGLTRLQGAAWVAELRKEFEAAISDSDALAGLDGQHPPGLEAFARRSAKVQALVRSIAKAFRAQVTSSSRTDSSPGAAGAAAGSGTDSSPGAAAAAGGSGASALAVASRALGAGLLPADPDESAADEADLQSGRDVVVLAAISGGVLMILLVISVATVRSIVVPIRQFMLTTESLANGDDTARFARGGIKELDALAVSFNRMADSLVDARAVTRQHQGELESRVDERTRQLQYLAEHDPLTGLPNRRQLVPQLDRSLHRAARDGRRVVVFFLDLDNFKNINDSMGHAFGDQVLTGVAQRLREAAGPNGFAARLGGDEFTVIHEITGDDTAIAKAGNNLMRAFQQPLSIEGRELVISISGGASIYPDHERGSDALLRAADAALFHAKHSGRARLSLFSPELLEVASLKFSLEQGLRRALERGELELWFQPEVSFTTLGTKLVEALIRWQLPNGEYVPPSDFLPVAEDAGLISSIHDWVLRTAIRQAAEWHHGEWPDIRVAINVSARQLLDTGFIVRLRELLEQHRLPPACIEVELTETVLQTEAATVDVLRELRRLGVSIALDDFGAGYSSLSSLERLPLTRVKLDRSLIDSIDTSPRSLAIARAIIGLCASLGLEVTAEGVERGEQLALLIENPGMTVQGYLLARPLRSDRVPQALSTMPARLQELLLSMPAAAPVCAHTPANSPELSPKAVAEIPTLLSNAT